MNVLSRLAKSLSVLLIALSLLLNISLGLAIFLIWRIIVKFKEMADLTTSGTRVMATVTSIEAKERGTITLTTPMRVKMPGKIYRIVATWQHPQTGKTYTLVAPTSVPDRFPIGSSAAFLVNYNNPLIHRLQDVAGAFTPLSNDQLPSQDA